MISTLILTKNEEVNLPRCLGALHWCDDIVILDSGSTDRTVELAKAAGARVFTREWDNERRQREFSRSLPFKYSWVFNPDADEIPTENLIEEMQRAVRNCGEETAVFRLRRRDMFLGKWIKRSSLYPTWLVRLFRPERIKFDREINLTIEYEGNQEFLQGHLLHYSFSNGVAAWITKHNRYSDFEATETVKCRLTAEFTLKGALSRDPTIRRRALKELSQRLPGRPCLRFVYMYFYRLGFLDGNAGLVYCLLVSFYELMIVVKVNELERKSRGEWM